MLLSACAVKRTPTIYRIALLAPFEGRYREIGYNALYAARMAFDYEEAMRRFGSNSCRLTTAEASKRPCCALAL